MKNSFGFIKTIAGFTALVLLGMIWWSSVLIEKDIKSVKANVRELKKETEELSYKIRKEFIVQHNRPTQRVSQSSLTNAHIDPTYPNLLQEDDYIKFTLPKMLKSGFEPRGIRTEGHIGKPENLHPFNGFRDVSVLHHLCNVSVAQLQSGKYETFAPAMAIKLEARPRQDNPNFQEYWIHLRNDVYWHPLERDHFPQGFELAPHFFEKHPVTAHDYKFFYDALMNQTVSETKAASLRSYYNDVESLRVIDDYTFVVCWKPHETIDENGQPVRKIKYTSLELTGGLQPLPRFVFQYFADGQKIVDDDSNPDTYRTNSVWAQNFSNHWAKNTIVSCGAFLFDGMNDEGICLRRNPDYYDPYGALVEGIHYTFKESLDAIWQDFKSDKLDMCSLSSNQLLELDSFLKSAEYKRQAENGSPIHILDYVDRSFSYLGWNIATPFFDNVKVRQAMTMAIDRNRIIEQNLNDMAINITGPLFCYSSAYDPTIAAWPFNPDRSRRILDEEGWIDLDGDGIRDKIINGKRVAFRFKLYYYVKNLSSKVIADYLATALKEIGVHCQPYGLDITDLSRQFDDKNFDAILLAWKLGTPPDDPRQLWHSSGAKEKGSSNAIGFINPEIDLIIELLNYEYDKEERIQLYHQFHKIIHNEAPYTFLYTPKVRLLYRDRVKNLFIPRENQDLIPGADIPEPNFQLVWLEQK